MKKYSKLMMMLAMSGMFIPSMPGGSAPTDNAPLTEDDIRRLKERGERMRKQQLLKSGCKEFHYQYKIGKVLVEEVTIVALNKKNADRKYDKFIKLWGESI